MTIDAEARRRLENLYEELQRSLVVSDSELVRYSKRNLFNLLRESDTEEVTPSQSNRIDRLEAMASELYQAAGAYNMPERVLDVLADMKNGDPIRHKTILPVMPDDEGRRE